MFFLFICQNDYMFQSIPSDTEKFAAQEIPAQYTNNQVRQAV